MFLAASTRLRDSPRAISITPVVVWAGLRPAPAPQPERGGVGTSHPAHRDHAPGRRRIPHHSRKLIGALSAFNIDGSSIHAPTGALIYQFQEVLAGRATARQRAGAARLRLAMTAREQGRLGRSRLPRMQRGLKRESSLFVEFRAEFTFPDGSPSAAIWNDRALSGHDRANAQESPGRASEWIACPRNSKPRGPALRAGQPGRPTSGQSRPSNTRYRIRPCPVPGRRSVTRPPVRSRSDTPEGVKRASVHPGGHLPQQG